MVGDIVSVIALVGFARQSNCLLFKVFASGFCLCMTVLFVIVRFLLLFKNIITIINKYYNLII